MPVYIPTNPNNTDPCTRCTLGRLRAKRNDSRIVIGDGPKTSIIAFIGEAPGEQEDRTGLPFYDTQDRTRYGDKSGDSGKELTAAIDNFLKMRREDVYITNICRCRPPSNRDPEPSEINTCVTAHLYRELESLPNLRIIVTLGRISGTVLTGDPEFRIEKEYGIPRPWHYNPDILVVPCYHPAASLYNPQIMMRYRYGMTVVRALRENPGSVESTRVDRFADREDYSVLSCPDDVRTLLGKSLIVGVDTEDDRYGNPWSVQFSASPGTGYMFHVSNQGCLDVFRSHVSNPKCLTVLHNAPHDLAVLDKVGVTPAKVRDTMTLSYLLQEPPMGLKSLAYRLCGMTMRSYKSIVNTSSKYNNDAMIHWFTEILAQPVDEPPPDPVKYRWSNKKLIGDTHQRHPQNLHRRLKRIITDYSKDPSISLIDRWNVIELEIRETTPVRIDPLGLDDVDPELSTWYACRDADATLRVHKELLKAFRGRGPLRGYPPFDDPYPMQILKLDTAMLPVVADMQRTGIKCNPVKLKMLEGEYSYKLDCIREVMSAYVHQFAPDIGEMVPESDDFVRHVVYNVFQVKKKRSTKKSKKAQVDDKFLSVLLQDKSAYKAHAFIQYVKKFRSYSKLLSTYLRALPKYIGEDGRIHSRFSLTRTATGRLASDSPNLMNIPIRTKEGKQIRTCFEADEDYILCSADYSQIELRVLAHESQDLNMLQVFMKGEDIHSFTASKAFGVPIDKLDKMKHRYPSKRLNFGIVYGISVFGLLDQLIMAGATQEDGSPWDKKSVSAFMDKWTKLFPGAHVFTKEQISKAIRYGYVENMFHRRRYIPGIRSYNKYHAAESERQAGNHPIQAGAADIMKKAMIALREEYREINKTLGFEAVRPLIQIHDDMIYEVHKSIAPMWYELQPTIMGAAYPLSVPTTVDPAMADNWGEI